jgi:hypothetical protein
LFLIALAAGLAVPAISADPTPAARGPHAGWSRPDFARIRAQRAAQRADDIALLIGLRPDQRPALDAFLATVEPGRHGDMGGARPPMGDTPPATSETTLQRLDKMSARLDRKDTEAKQRIDATRKFYTSLTPDQQRRFDALDRLHHSGMRGGMHGGHHGMMGRPPMGPNGAPPPAPTGE